MKPKIMLWIGLLALAGIGSMLSGCNTAGGFGRDVEKVGEEVQEGVD